MSETTIVKMNKVEYQIDIPLSRFECSNKLELWGKDIKIELCKKFIDAFSSRFVGFKSETMQEKKILRVYLEVYINKYEHLGENTAFIWGVIGSVGIKV